MLYNTLAVLLIVFSNIYCTLAYSEGCLTGIDLYAGTGGVKNAGSDSDFQYVFHYHTDSKRSQPIELYDRPGNDMTKNQGDFWTVAAPEECVTPDDISEENYIETLSGKDGWYVDNSITYGAVLDGNDQNQLILISHNYEVNSWADTSLVPPQDTITLETNHINRDNCAIKDQCITNIYVVGTTGNEKNAGSDDDMYFYLNDYEFLLPDLPGDDMEKNKADLWKVTASAAGISGCLKFGDVTKAGIHSGGSDGWYINHAIATVQLDTGDYALLAGNTDWFKWVDEHNRLDLTMKNQCTSQGISKGEMKRPCIPQTATKDIDEETMPPCTPPQPKDIDAEN